MSGASPLEGLANAIALTPTVPEAVQAADATTAAHQAGLALVDPITVVTSKSQVELVHGAATGQRSC